MTDGRKAVADMGPLAQPEEVCVAGRLPPTETLEELLTFVQELKSAITHKEVPHLWMSSVEMNSRCAELKDALTDLLTTPLATDFLLVVLPHLVDVSRRGRQEEANQRYGPPKDPRKKY